MLTKKVLKYTIEVIMMDIENNNIEQIIETAREYGSAEIIDVEVLPENPHK